MMWLALVLASLTVLACSARPPATIIDGWPIGSPTECTPEVRCDELLDEAVRGLTERDPGHADIVAFALHEEDLYVDDHTILLVRSGNCCRAVRFELADGSVRAIGVGFPGVSQEPIAFDYGP